MQLFEKTEENMLKSSYQADRYKMVLSVDGHQIPAKANDIALSHDPTRFFKHGEMPDCVFFRDAAFFDSNWVQYPILFNDEINLFFIWIAIVVKRGGGRLPSL
nr:hypothetical protein [uncultured Desulfobacter sp.]